MNAFFSHIMKQEFIRHVIGRERKSTTDLFHATVDFISESTSKGEARFTEISLLQFLVKITKHSKD